MQLSKEVSLAGSTYTIQAFNPTTGLELLTRLMKAVGPSVAAFTNVDPKKVQEAIPGAIQALVANLHEKETPRLIKDLLGCVFINGQPVNGPQFEVHFQGKLGTMFQLLIEVVTFQFADFLAALPIVRPPAVVK